MAVSVKQEMRDLESKVGVVVGENGLDGDNDGDSDGDVEVDSDGDCSDNGDDMIITLVGTNIMMIPMIMMVVLTSTESLTDAGTPHWSTATFPRSTNTLYTETWSGLFL